MKERKEDKGGGSGWVDDMKQISPVFYLLSVSLWSSANTFHICLFVQCKSLRGEGKQSSNSTNVIMARSDRRPYHSPRFKNRVAPQTPQATTQTWQQSSRRRGVRNPNSKEQRPPCVLIGSKRSGLGCDVWLNKMYKGRIRIVSLSISYLLVLSPVSDMGSVTLPSLLHKGVCYVYGMFHNGIYSNMTKLVLSQTSLVMDFKTQLKVSQWPWMTRKSCSYCSKTCR